MDISKFIPKPVPVETSLGLTYLYSPTLSDLTEYRKLKRQSSGVELWREYIAGAASSAEKTGEDGKRIQLPHDWRGRFTTNDLSKLAAEYLLLAQLPKAKQDGAALECKRNDGDSAVDFVLRVLDEQYAAMVSAQKLKSESVVPKYMQALLKMEGEAKRLKELTQSFEIPDSIKQATDSFRAHEDILKSLRIAPSPLFPEVGREEVNRFQENERRLREVGAKARDDREAELQYQRTTAELSATTASALGQLVTAFSAFQVGFRDEQAHSSKLSRIGLWVAVAALCASVVVSGTSVVQDYLNNQWVEQVRQEELLKSKSESDEMHKKVERLENSNAELEASLKQLREAQPSNLSVQAPAPTRLRN